MSKRYSKNQRQAYYSGMGYSVGYKNRKINFRSDTLKQSFREGYAAGIRSQRKSPDKYPKLK